jgi:hypothetical protein
MNTKDVMVNVFDKLGYHQAKALQDEVLEHIDPVWGDETLEFSIGEVVEVVSPNTGKKYEVPITHAYLLQGFAKYTGDGNPLYTNNMKKTSYSNLKVTKEDMQFIKKIPSKLKKKFTKDDVKKTKGLTLKKLRTIADGKNPLILRWIECGEFVYRVNPFYTLVQV